MTLRALAENAYYSLEGNRLSEMPEIYPDGSYLIAGICLVCAAAALLSYCLRGRRRR